MRHLFTFITVVILLFTNGLVAQDFQVEKINDFAGDSRFGAVGFSIGEYGYVGLGKDGNNFFNDLWKFDPQNNSWTAAASFPGVERLNAVSFVVGNYAYVGTGEDKDGNLLKDFYKYSAADNEWEAIADFAGDARYSAVAFAIGNYGYAGTGATADGDSKDFWKYDPGTNQWTQIENAPDARRNASAASVGGLGYLVAGQAFGSFSQVFSDVHAYDPVTNQWTEKIFADGMRLSFNSATAFVLFDNIYIAYGNHDFVTQYNPSTNSVTKIDDVFSLGKRFYPISFTINDMVYLGTGYTMIDLFNLAYHKDFYSFTVDVAEAQIFNVSGDTYYCAGSTSDASIHLSSSEDHISYQLYKNNEKYGQAVVGTGSALSWNNLTEGEYKVKAWNGKAEKLMDGTVSIEEIPLLDVTVVISTEKTQVNTNQQVVINATVNNSGLTFLFTWKVNNQSWDINHTGVFSFTPEDGDVVTCEISSTGYSCLNRELSKSNEIVFSVATSTVELDADLKVFPNPVSSTLFVNNPVSGGEVKVSISSIQGQIVLSQITDRNYFSLDVSHLPEGTYILKVQGQNTMHKSMFIKQ